MALAGRYLLGFSWIEAGLVGAALAPTDPAVTFSAFGKREIRGRSGTILEREAAVNDPVGIALMSGMLELAGDRTAAVDRVQEFVVEMALGLAVGLVGAWLLLPVFRRVELTGLALYPIRLLAGAGILYGLAAVLGGSGFLAVFVAGIMLGDAAMPRKGEIESFHSSLAGLAEIAVFIGLGLTISLGELDSLGIWVDGIVIALVLAVVARPLAVLPLLLPARLTMRERLFVTWGGLKGAVPILLGALAVMAAVEGASDLYGIVFIVVVFSVVVQGTSLPYVARRLRIPFRRVDYDLAEIMEFVVGENASASGRAIGELPLGERAWVGVLVRDGRPRPIDADVVLEPVIACTSLHSSEHMAALERIFSGGPPSALRAPRRRADRIGEPRCAVEKLSNATELVSKPLDVPREEDGVGAAVEEPHRSRNAGDVHRARPEDRHDLRDLGCHEPQATNLGKRTRRRWDCRPVAGSLGEDLEPPRCPLALRA